MILNKTICIHYMLKFYMAMVHKKIVKIRLRNFKVSLKILHCDISMLLLKFANLCPDSFTTNRQIAITTT